MAEPRKQSLGESGGEGLSPIEVKDAREATLAFLMAVKNYGLFPPDHASTGNMLVALTATLDGFAERYGPLRLNIEKSRIRYEDEVIFEESNPDDNPAFIFFRDGLLWLEFLPGLQYHEILTFFRIISRFKLSQDEPEGDLVTELWSADLPHVNHEASENLWEAEPVLEFSLLNPNAQAVLEYGVAASVAGFDLLKSVLGIAATGEAGPLGIPPKSEFGPGESGGAGHGHGGRGNGDLSGGAMGEGAGHSTPAAGGGGAGGSVAADRQPALTSSGGLDGGGGTAAEVDADELDFWAALRLVSPSGRAVPGEAALVPGGAGGGPAPEGHGGAAGQGGSGAHGESAPEPGNQLRGAEVMLPGQFGLPGGGGSGGGSHSPHRPGGTGVGGSGTATGGLSEMSSRRASAFSRPGRGGDWEDDRGEGENYISVNVASIEPGHSLWKFTGDEQSALKRMVRQYEEDDNSGDIIEVLLILLKLEDEPPIFSAILAFLKEEFRITLTNRRFGSGHDLLAKVKQVHQQLPAEKEWARPLLGQFFDEVAEPEILDALVPVWRELPSLKPEMLHDFSAILRLLPPRAGMSLVPLSAQVGSGIGRQVLIELIAVYASQDLTILEKMLDRPEEDLTLRLIHVLRESPDRRKSEQLLFKAIKHPKEKVRLEVCEILLARDSEQYDKIFQLLSDNSPAIREQAFAYLGRERNREVEALFLAHIASDRFLIENPEQVANCYLALGLCGSDNSLPLLKQILFGQPWNFMLGLGARPHRQGAAIALSRLRTKGAKKLLAEAEASSFPHIRTAWQKASGKRHG